MTLQQARIEAAKLFDIGGAAWLRESDYIGQAMSERFAREMAAGCWDHRAEVQRLIEQTA